MNTKRKIAFFGSPDFSAHLMERIVNELRDSVEISLVITQPDKKVGRKQLLTPSPVKAASLKLSLPVHEGLPSPDALHGLDLAVLYAYGEIISADILAAPRHGIWNIHPSLLPLYRSSSVMIYPLLLGDARTGVTLMQMDEQLDHGPIIAQREYPINSSTTRLQLEPALTDIGFSLFKESLEKLNANTLKATPQHHADATFTREVKKDDGYIPFAILKKSMDPGTAHETGFVPEVLLKYYRKNSHIPPRAFTAAETVWNMYRALHPWPGVWTTVMIEGVEKRLKLLDVSVETAITLRTVQLEGKNAVDMETFSRAYTLF